MRILAAATITLSLVSCTQLSDKPAPPPTFPNHASVALIETVDGARSVSDPQEIARFLGEIREIRTGWSFTWHTYPTPQKSVFLKDKDNKNLCRLDFGPRWIGSDCGQAGEGWPPLTGTSATQDQYFQTFLDAKWR